MTDSKEENYIYIYCLDIDSHGTTPPQKERERVILNDIEKEQDPLLSLSERDTQIYVQREIYI